MFQEKVEGTFHDPTYMIVVPSSKLRSLLSLDESQLEKPESYFARSDGVAFQKILDGVQIRVRK